MKDGVIFLLFFFQLILCDPGLFYRRLVLLFLRRQINWFWVSVVGCVVGFEKGFPFLSDFVKYVVTEYEITVGF